MLEIENGEVARAQRARWQDLASAVHQLSSIVDEHFWSSKINSWSLDLNWMEAADIGQKLFLIALSVSNLCCVTAEE